MKKALLFFSCIAFIMACNSSGEKERVNPYQVEKKSPNDGKGVGEITQVNLNDPLDPAMVDRGEAIYELKCAACHKLTATRVVGPGWLGVTEKRRPEWIMNMVTNVDVMLEKDPTAQALLKECLTRMPNQNLTTENARDVLEFMYANDGKAVGN